MPLAVSPFAVGTVLALVFWYRALNELSEFGMRNHTQALWALGFGPGRRREYFTAAGQRYRRWALSCGAGGFAASAFLITFGS